MKMKFFSAHLLVISCFVLVSPAAIGNGNENQPADSTLMQKIHFSLSADGFILSSAFQTYDPFYHASGLFNSVLRMDIGEKVSVPLRVVAEDWNFSAPYGDANNRMFWAKPAVNFKLPVHVLFVDSVYLVAGDLGRIKHGQGLSLDYFESQGAYAEVTFLKKFRVEMSSIGWGWTGMDDIKTIGLCYRNLFAIRFFNNYDNFQHGEYVRQSRIYSADFSVPVAKDLKVYGEAGFNYDNDNARALMAGIKYSEHETKKVAFDASLEYRFYEKDFLKFQSVGLPFINSYPYFNSLTALDKPVHTFRYYQPMYFDADGIAVKVMLKYYFYDRFFFYTHDEIIFRTEVTDFAYEATIGYEPVKNVNLHAGINNKFFRLYSLLDDGPMFSLHDEPWVMLKADFAFGTSW